MAGIGAGSGRFGLGACRVPCASRHTALQSPACLALAATPTLPPMTQALSDLVTRYGQGVLLDNGQLAQLYEAFAARQRAAAAGTLATADMTLPEFRETMAALSLDAGDSGSDWVTTLFSLFDKDNSGLISFEEMAVGLALLTKGSYEERMEYGFDAFDLDRDGRISQAELAHLAAAATGLPDSECAAIAANLMHVHDIDRSGYLDRNEFKVAVGSDPRLAYAFWSSASL